ncbi:MAG TPA: Ig-like domain-containing protein, partial [Pyrinomonadaceae bacterium]|nr:Ig-like domain-containing protein [Pyrinomonadaceae bacterium]
MNRPRSLIAVCSITLALLAVACLLSLSSKAAPASTKTINLAPPKDSLASATATSPHSEASNTGLLASPPNQPPVAGDDTLLVHGVTSLTQLLANDSDPDGNPISLGATTEPEHGDIFFGSYHPDSAYTGADGFSYEVCDNQGACDTGNVTVDVRNNTPNANDDSYQIHGTTTVGPLLQNDSDQDNDALTLTAFITNPEHGLLLNSNTPDVFSYVPASSFTGQDGFIYKVCDSLGACDTASVTLNITNGAPTPVAKRYEIRGNTIIGPILAGDTDPEDDAITLNSIVTPPANGGLFNTATSDVFEYRPGSGFSGSDSFVYRECDNLGACSNATVTLHAIGDGEDLGPTSCNAGVADPVNVTNGNMYLQQTDYSLPGAGPTIDITRTYNSMSESIGLFGRGWSTAYDEKIVSYDADMARFNQADGRAIYFGRGAGTSGDLLPLAGDFHGQLAQSLSGFTLTMKDGTIHEFNISGQLESITDRNGNQTTLTYTSHRLSAITDPFGRVLTLTADSNGRVTSITDAIDTVATYTYDSGRLKTLTYADDSGFVFDFDAGDRIISITDALGHVVESHTYDSGGRALTSERQDGVRHYDFEYLSATETKVTDALGNVSNYTFERIHGRNVVTEVEGLCSCGGSGSEIQHWTYDSQLNVTSKADALDHTTSFTYDGAGNRLTETDATGTVTNTYNQFGDVLTRTDQLGGVTTNTYDTDGNLLTTEDALQHTTTFTNDSRGQLLTTTDARGKVTTSTRDTSGRLTEVEDALNNVTTAAYDDRARVTSLTNALNETTSCEYDAAGRLQKLIYPDSNFVLFTYDLAGRRTIVKDPRGNETTFGYDDANRLTSVTDALSHVTSFGYDLMSNRTSMTDALSRVTNYEFDDFNRLKKITYPPATTGATRLFETIEYDDAGNVIERTDTAGRVTAYAYDDVNRRISTTDPDNKTTSFDYDELSRTIQVQDALDQKYEFAYDLLGRQTGMTRNAVSMSYGYDAVGNPTSRTDYNGATTDYTYDDLNRLTTMSYPDSASVTYAYDGLSRLTTAANENGTVTFSYDSRGRVSETTDVWGKTLGYSYDANGNRVAMSLDSSDYASYSYDEVNRQTRVNDAATRVVDYSYDATNKLSSRALRNGVTATYTYDNLDRLTHLNDSYGTTAILDNHCSYNTASQIVEKVDVASTTDSYDYDPLDRLTSSSSDGGSYSYDEVGNR